MLNSRCQGARTSIERAEVELASDASSGPYVGVHRLPALEVLARWVTHVSDHYETRVRYYRAYATRRRLWWRRRGVVPEGTRGAPAQSPVPSAAAPADDGPALRARRRRWADLLRRVFEIEVSLCHTCSGDMRIVAFVTAQCAAADILEQLSQGFASGRFKRERRERLNRSRSHPPALQRLGVLQNFIESDTRKSIGKERAAAARDLLAFPWYILSMLYAESEKEWEEMYREGVRPARVLGS